MKDVTFVPHTNWENKTSGAVTKTKEIPCLTGKGMPTTSTIGAVGCLYMDENTGAVYKCTAVSENGEYTWVALIDKAEIQSIVDAYNAQNTPQNGEDGGHYTPTVTQPTSTTMKVEFTPSKPGMPAVEPVTVTLPVSDDSAQNVALTDKERSTLIAVVNAIGVFNAPNGQELVSAFTAAWSGDTPDEPVVPDEPDTPDEPEQPTENLFHIGEMFVNAANTPEIEWEDYGCSWKSIGNWSQACTMTGLEAGKTYTMFADATVNGAAPTLGNYITAKVVSWTGTPSVSGFDGLATFYPSPASGSWAGYAEFTVPVDAQAVGLAFVSSSTSATNRIYNVAVYEGSMTVRP